MTSKIALGNVNDDEDVRMPRSFVAPSMEVECSFCGALRYRAEAAGLCCSGGKVDIPLPPNLPDDLHRKVTEDADFLKDIRKYNQVFAFTSIGCRVDEGLANAREGIYTFRISGQVYHRIGPAQPNAGEEARFAQIYFFDRETQAHRRCTVMPGLDIANVLLVNDILHDVNPYVHLYRQAAELGPLANYSICFRNAGVDLRRYNAPSVSEVGALLLDGDGQDEARQRDVRVQCRGGRLVRLSELHSAYDPLMYVIMFPYGTPGWHVDLMQRGGSKRVTMRQFVAHRLMIRKINLRTNPLHLCGRLTQQYVVDQYAKIESNNLSYIRTNQSALRADCYDRIRESLERGCQRIGRRVVLPSTFTGSPRQMLQLFQDSMALVRKYGKADLFVTVTCNPKWKAITDQLLLNQTAQDRPDIVARVFNQYLKAIMNEIVKKHIFGTVRAHIYTIEFQKRGLPHAHILLWLSAEDRPRSALDCDKFISAEIPDQNVYPELFNSVSANMVHGPCGAMNPNAPCMKDGKCSKGFPKPFCDATIDSGDGYPSYRRRNNGTFITKRVKGRLFQLDNRWIVPYNWYLSVRYQCHINVEQCSSVQSVRYIHKYVCKGTDRASVRVSPINGEHFIDEVSDYVDARYISPVEACWRIFSFKMHSQSHVVQRLPVHLPDQQSIVFDNNDMIDISALTLRTTKLLAFFHLCSVDENARNLCYHQVPLFYVWKRNEWVKRQRNVTNVIGRMYTVSITEGERYHLRMLLCHVMGPRNFEDLRTFNGCVYNTFKDACIARGLLENDREWLSCMTDAALTASPRQLRQLFATIIVFGQPANPADLFTEFFNSMSIDFAHTHNSPELLLSHVAADIDSTLRQFGFRWEQVTGLPHYIPIESSESDSNTLISEELDYDREILTTGVAKVQYFNTAQNEIFETIKNAVNHPNEKWSNLFFINGEGGAGKTFLYDGMASYFRLKRNIVLTVASSGIASLLLPGGRTAHSRFQIPLNVQSNSTCNISAQSELAQLLASAHLIIWDEAPMMHRYAFEALNRTLQDILLNNRPMGGKIVILGGDWRQILPVVLRGSQGQIVSASLMRSRLWAHISTFTLIQNMRVQAHQIEHMNWLRSIGDGTHDNYPMLKIPDNMLINDGNISTLVDAIFPDFEDHFSETNYLMSRVIVAPTHKDVNFINTLMSERLPSTCHSKTYLSADSIQREGEVNENLFPLEFLNSLEVNGLPPHNLTLSEGMPVMLLRNLNKAMGLCNGTRLIVNRLQDHVIEAVVITGDAKGTHVYIPRISLSPPESTLPFILRRRQFPVKPAYAMTINKAQGQTIDIVGVSLLQPVFSHGQLYVALSRARDCSNVKILLPNGQTETPNVVFKSIFNSYTSIPHR